MATLLGVIAFTTLAPARTADRRAFANPRFGFSVEVPANFRAPPPANGGGAASSKELQGTPVRQRRNTAARNTGRDHGPAAFASP